MNRVAEIASLTLTIPTIVFGLMVVWVWSQTAKSMRINPIKKSKSSEWFILGVIIGFFGSTIDNIYWGISWSLHYIESDHANWWFENGVWSNVPFRQIAGLMSGICHIKSAIEFRKEFRLRDGKMTDGQKFILIKILLLCIAAGLVFCLALSLMK